LGKAFEGKVSIPWTFKPKKFRIIGLGIKVRGINIKKGVGIGQLFQNLFQLIGYKGKVLFLTKFRPKFAFPPKIR